MIHISDSSHTYVIYIPPYLPLLHYISHLRTNNSPFTSKSNQVLLFIKEVFHSFPIVTSTISKHLKHLNTILLEREKRERTNVVKSQASPTGIIHIHINPYPYANLQFHAPNAAIPMQIHIHHHHQSKVVIKKSKSNKRRKSICIRAKSSRR